MGVNVRMDQQQQNRLQHRLEAGMPLTEAIGREVARVTQAPSRRAFKGIMPRKDAARLRKAAK